MLNPARRLKHAGLLESYLTGWRQQNFRRSEPELCTNLSLFIYTRQRIFPRENLSEQFNAHHSQGMISGLVPV